MKRVLKLFIVLSLVIAIALAGGSGGYQPSVHDGESNSYNKYENGGTSSDDEHDSSKKFVDQADKKNFEKFDRDAANSKFGKQAASRKSKFSDNQSKRKNVRAREQDDFDNDKNQVAFKKNNIKKLDKQNATKLKKFQDDVDSENKDKYTKNNLSKKNANKSKSSSFADHSEADDEMDKATGMGSSGSTGSTGSAGNMGARKHWQKHKMGKQNADENMSALDKSNVDKFGQSRLNKKKRATDYDTRSAKKKLDKDSMDFGKNQSHQKQRKNKQYDVDEEVKSNVDKKDKQENNKIFKDSNSKSESGKKFNKASAMKKRKQNNKSNSKFSKNAQRKKDITRDVKHAKGDGSYGSFGF